MDQFRTSQPGLESPASGVFALVPDDAQDLPVATRGINAAVSGYLRLTTVDGTVGTVFVAAGTVFPIRARRVWATGTDAAGLAGLY
ncbi:spike base protein, RCAP_Rcc01079 family [Histidinibacterium aquaticum]|uniref:Uncharacterized protein n=1 Tax=Histidinibacterium aquaticum TaxID=2613962 RepID=A0A5J5GJC5_9RHOB|nr:hypothetical protein [Histidinibacterium aquaticum]KAA9008217.1 hypothetical protein F3S47_12050 [Histidinibacterium aquaticum]